MQLQNPNICNYIISLDTFPKKGFFGPLGQTVPSWGWRLSTCDGLMYGMTGNNSEKKEAKNIMRGWTWLPAYYTKVIEIHLLAHLKLLIKVTNCHILFNH